MSVQIDMEEEMRRIASILDQYLADLFGHRLGFCMILFQFNTPGSSNYISNAKREDMINHLKEAIERLQSNKDQEKPVPFSKKISNEK